MVGYSIHYNSYEKMGLELTPEVLVQKARETIARLGYPGRPADSAYDIDQDSDLLQAIEKNDKPRPDWNAVLAGRPTLVHLWYRQSPDGLSTVNIHDNLLTPGIVGEQEPRRIGHCAGDCHALLFAAGQLRRAMIQSPGEAKVGEEFD